jgi:hypothetical protein
LHGGNDQADAVGIQKINNGIRYTATLADRRAGDRPAGGA